MLGVLQRRERRVVILVTDEELKRLDALASASGMARGAYVRHRILYADRPGEPTAPECTSQSSRVVARVPAPVQIGNDGS